MALSHELQLLSDNKLRIITYNMHGFNQGSHTLPDIIHELKPDICMLQEHWLTPANLSKLDDGFLQYLCFGTSAEFYHSI